MKGNRLPAEVLGLRDMCVTVELNPLEGCYRFCTETLQLPFLWLRNGFYT